MLKGSGADVTTFVRACGMSSGKREADGGLCCELAERQTGPTVSSSPAAVACVGGGANVTELIFSFQATSPARFPVYRERLELGHS